MNIRKLFVSLGSLSAVGLAPLLMAGGFAPNQPRPVVPPEPMPEEQPQAVIPEDPNLAPVIAPGFRGPILEDVQVFLQDEGLYEGPIDLIYGPITEQAIIRFQEENDLLANGIIGPETWEILIDQMNNDDISTNPIGDGTIIYPIQ